MPVIRTTGPGGGEGEALGRPGAAAGGVTGDVARVANNLELSDYVGRFVAGELAHQFSNENLADSLKGKNAIHVSFSWG